MHLVHKGRKNTPNKTVIRKHRVPEENQKERKGQKEAEKEGQLNELPDAMINLGSHIFIDMSTYTYTYIHLTWGQAQAGPWALGRLRGAARVPPHVMYM